MGIWYKVIHARIGEVRQLREILEFRDFEKRRTVDTDLAKSVYTAEKLRSYRREDGQVLLTRQIRKHSYRMLYPATFRSE